jgi:hypothetical protein
MWDGEEHVWIANGSRGGRWAESRVSALTTITGVLKGDKLLKTMVDEFRVRFKYTIAIMGDCFLGRLEHSLGARGSASAEQPRLVLSQVCATETKDVGFTRPGVSLTILVSDLST